MRHVWSEKSAGSGRSALAILGLLAAVAITAFIRLLHLANPAHYYILSQDSHFFHWQAGRLLAGDSVPMAWHGGLTYPLAYGARMRQLHLWRDGRRRPHGGGKLLPPAIGVAGMLVMYWGVGRLYGRRAALGAAFLWAVLGYVYWTQAGGYLDRDGLSMVLLAAGVFAFHLSGQLHVKVRGLDLGWVLGSLAVMAVMALLVAGMALAGCSSSDGGAGGRGAAGGCRRRPRPRGAGPGPPGG